MLSKKAMKVAVFSALFADGCPEDIPESFDKIPGWDYILFTNCDPGYFPDTTWSIRAVPLPSPSVIPCGETVSRQKFIYANRFYKWHPQEQLSDYDVVIYIDSPKVLNVQYADLWKTYANYVYEQRDGRSIIQGPAQHNNTIYEEVDLIVRCRKARAEHAQIVRCFLQSQGCPNLNIVWNGCYVLNNKCPDVRRVFEQLWKDMCTVPCYRDQVLYVYEFWKLNVLHRILVQPALEAATMMKGRTGYHIYT